MNTLREGWDGGIASTVRNVINADSLLYNELYSYCRVRELSNNATRFLRD